jgi:ribosomal protein S17E
MKGMRVVVIAAIIAGLCSLVGVGCIVYYMLQQGDSQPSATVDTIQQQVSQPSESRRDTQSNRLSEPTIPSQEKVKQEPVKEEQRPVIKFYRPYFIPILRDVDETRRSLRKIKAQLQREEIARTRQEAEEAKIFEVEAVPDEVTPPTKKVAPPKVAENLKEPVPKVTPQQALPKQVPAKQSERTPVVEPPVVKENTADVQGKRVVTVRQSRERGQVDEKVLTARELMNVFNNIIDEKNENDNNAACVHIQSIPESEKVANQISAYLTSKGFSMAGRSEAPGKSIGIRVTAKTSCITITVGKL